MTKVIVYTHSDGGVRYVIPAPGARLARNVRLADGTVLMSDVPQPVDRFLRRWPVEGATPEWAETEEEFLQRIRAKDIPPDAQNVAVVDVGELPRDRTFREAWKLSGGRVEYDLQKCREIWRNKLRAERAPKLAELDIEFYRALERNDHAAMSAIAEKKQALRDAPSDPRIEQARSIEELKRVTLPE